MSIGQHPEQHPILWEASTAQKQDSNIWRYMQWLAREKDLKFSTYDALWQWSITDLEAFWGSVWEFCGLKARTPYTKVLAKAEQPGAQWFPDVQLNYVDQFIAAGAGRGTQCAIRHGTEKGDDLRDVSWNELLGTAGALAGHFKRLGIKPGDRIAAILPNAPEAVMSLLAVASVGATWSSCAPEMGERAVIDRFSQISPRILIVVDGYDYGGKTYDRREAMAGFVQQLPSLEQVIVIPRINPELGAQGIASASAPAITWQQACAQPQALDPVAVPFDHPLWIVYSSGTTGLPKGIVHSHGGILIEHLKSMILHHEAKPSDVYCWMSSTGWIVWNIHVASLMTGGIMAIYEGRPDYPGPESLWKFLEKSGTTIFGCGAAFYTGAMKAGVKPKELADLSRLRGLGSTGSPLPDEAYDWIYANINSNTWLAPSSGGTDFAAGFVGGSILEPVRRGEMQCRMLGCAVYAFDPNGKTLVNEVGELVCTTPLPSMPIYFWNDPEGKRYHDAYYDMYPGVWRHGDWIRVSDRGTSIIYGRSDSTINRYGIRMGTAEIYRVVEDLEEIQDSMVVDLEFLGKESYMPLFVVLTPGASLDEKLLVKLREKIKANLSARYLPNEIFPVPGIPRTLTGKKMEIPIKRLLLGEDPKKIANRDAMANPDAMDWYLSFAAKRSSS